MVKCFKCSFNFLSPQELFSHMKDSHKISDDSSYACTICRSQFTKMWKYQRHVTLCFQKLPDSVHQENADAINVDVKQRNLLEFEKSVKQKTLEFICKLASNMNIPRNYVFELVNDFQSLYSAIILEGIDRFMKPSVGNEEQIYLEYFTKICNDPFMQFKTEYKLDEELKTLDLVSPLIPIDTIRKKKSEEENIGEEEENIDEESENPPKRFKDSDENGAMMPLRFQFKSFFELPKVFELTQSYANEILKDTNRSHFINSETWQKKIKSFNSNDTVIPFHLFIDDTQVNNALGSHRSKGLETCTYYSFPTIPPQYSSRLENIFVAQLFSSGATKKFGNFECFSQLIAAINEMARDPVILNVDENEEKV